MPFSHAFFLYVATLKVVDALVVFGVWHLCWYLRFDISLIPVTKGLPPYSMYTRAALPLIVVFLIVFHLIGAYRHDRVHFGFRALKKIVQGSLLGTLVFISVCYFLGEVNYSRAYLILFFVVVGCGLTFSRLGIHFIWTFIQRHWLTEINILLVGEGNLLEMYFKKIQERRPYPVNWVGRIGNKIGQGRLAQLAYLGPETRLEQVLSNYAVNEVVLSYPPEFEKRYNGLLKFLTNELVNVKVIPDYGTHNTFIYSADQEFGIPFLTFNQTPAGASDRFIKRLFDVLGSLLLLVLFAPAMVFIALLVKLTSKGPIIYKQERVGADGRRFACYKFRSMRLDAEKNTGPVWASKQDDRRTAFGQWLRATSMDELPQFFNVLRGDMSLVGPRPERPIFVSQFKKEIPKYMLRHKMKSGCTGWAQVNGLRGNTSLEARIKYDLYYIGHWSHLFDLKILTLTPWALLRGVIKGDAY